MADINGDMLKGAMNAEGALSRNESHWMEREIEQLPDGHPVKEEARKVQNSVGDLSQIPENHPLAEALREYEQRKQPAEEKEQAQPTEESRKIKRVRKIDEKQAERERRENEEEEQRQRRESLESYNRSIDEAVETLSRIRGNVQASKQDFENDRFVLNRMERMERMIQTVERGMAQSKINVGRVNNG